MKWRDSAGLTIAVLVLLGLSHQPIARWVVTRTVSQFLPGSTTMAGSVSWDPVRHTWTCNQLRIETDGLESIRAARATVLLDASELMRRNLLIDSARVDGMVIPIPKRHRDSHVGSRVSTHVFPTFQPELWLDSQLHQYKSEILSALQRHEQRHVELRKQLDRLQARCDEIKVTTSPNPLRSRGDIQDVRREMANILQSLAEERIQIRETDRGLEKTRERMRNAWQEDLANVVVKPLPERSKLVQQIAEKSLAQYWESRRHLMRCVSVTATPLAPQESVVRGKEVKIPDLPNNYVKIRSANLSGYVEIEDEKPIRFRASVAGWGDESCATDARADWHFELPGTETPRSIQAHIEGMSPRTSSSPALQSGFTFTWTEHPNPELACRGFWQQNAEGDRLELSVPIDVIADMPQSESAVAFEGKIDWESCWRSAIENYRGRYLHASLPLTSPDSVRSKDYWQCEHPEVNQESLALVSEIWERTLAAYLVNTVDRMQPRVGGLHHALDQFRTQCWSSATQARIDAIAHLERDVLSLRDRWEEYCKQSDRVARLRGSMDNY